MFDPLKFLIHLISIWYYEVLVKIMLASPILKYSAEKKNYKRVGIKINISKKYMKNI